MFEVYVHTCAPTGKVYVGYTGMGVGRRFNDHCAHAKAGSPFKFHRAIRKYGRDVWVTHVLATAATVQEAKRLEVAFISQMRANHRLHGYNMTEGGEGGVTMKGRKLSPEHRAKVVAALRANPPSREAVARRCEARRGVARTDAERLAMSEGMRLAKSGGLTPSQQEQLARMHAKNKGAVRSEETKRKISAAVSAARQKKKEAKCSNQ